MKRGLIFVAALCLALGASKEPPPAPKDPPGVVRMTPEQQKTIKLQTARADHRPITEPVGVTGTVAFDQGHVATQAGISAAMGEKVKAAVPGVSLELSQPIQMRMDDLLQGVRSDVALTVYREDLNTLTTLADQAVRVVRAVQGAADVRSEQEGTLPTMTVRVDRARLARIGNNSADVLAVVEAVGGRSVGMV